MIGPTTEVDPEVSRHVDQLPDKEELEEIIGAAVAEMLSSVPLELTGIPPDSPFMQRWYPVGVKKVDYEPCR